MKFRAQPKIDKAGYLLADTYFKMNENETPDNRSWAKHSSE
jgi:hypothetical protein